jgi:hypothetical protein
MSRLSLDFTGSSKAVSGSLASIDISSYSCLGTPELYVCTNSGLGRSKQNHRCQYLLVRLPETSLEVQGNPQDISGGYWKSRNRWCFMLRHARPILIGLWCNQEPILGLLNLKLHTYIHMYNARVTCFYLRNRFLCESND